MSLGLYCSSIKRTGYSVAQWRIKSNSLTSMKTPKYSKHITTFRNYLNEGYGRVCTG